MIAIVGDVDADDIAAQVAARVRRARGEAEPVPLAAAGRGQPAIAARESRDKAQTALVVAFEGPARLRSTIDSRRRSIATIASGLGGRFFDELRDRQSLAYTVQAFASERELAGTFIPTSPRRRTGKRSRGAGCSTSSRSSATPRSPPRSSQRAKTYAIGTRAIRQESGAAVLGELVDAWLYGAGLGELTNTTRGCARSRRATSATPARRYFVEDRRVEGIVRGTPKTV